MAKGPYGESQWGQNWTNNSVYQEEQEQKRQRAVVASFIANTPEYYRCTENDKQLVDFIEASKRPFTIETLNWAYKERLYFLKKKKENPFNKILKGFSNLGDSNSSDMAAKDLEIEQEKLHAYLNKKEKAAFIKAASLPPIFPQEVATPAVSDSIAVIPMSTVRRIKHDE